MKTQYWIGLLLIVAACVLFVANQPTFSSCTILSNSTFAYADLTGEQQIPLRNLREGQFITIETALQSGQLDMQVICKQNSVALSAKRPLFSNTLLYTIPTDGDYTIALNGSSASFSLAVSVAMPT